MAVSHASSTIPGSRVAVIPARYDSQRFPGKPLAPVGGRPMIEWAWRRACAAERIDRVLVATDDDRIAEAVRAFGGQAVMTARHHTTGTDRIAEAIRDEPGGIIVNIQGDEPLMPPEVIDQLVAVLEEGRDAMATVAVPFDRPEQVSNPNMVKVVCDQRGAALYFSRACIPYCREGGTPVEPLLHWGVYAYRRETLETFVSWHPAALECCEKLEQLRALENGMAIRVLVVERNAPDVNVPDDIPQIEDVLRERGEIE